MFTIYVYVLDTLADWELGYITSELHSGRFFKKDAGRVSLKTVSYSKEPIHTMGGLTIVPDCLIDDIVVARRIEEKIICFPPEKLPKEIEKKDIVARHTVERVHRKFLIDATLNYVKENA